MTRISACIFLLIALVCLSGCGLGAGSTVAPVTTASAAARTATGVVHGGQNPVTGATIQLWQVGTSGYGSVATPLIGATVTTSDGSALANANANAGNNNNALPAGNFTLNFTGAYTCPTSTTLVYMTATGGNPGLAPGTNNSALVLLAPLGQCGSLNSTTFVSLNEVTTVGAAFALAPFIGVGGSIGSPSDPASLQAIANTFAGVGNLVNTSTGVALATTTAGNTVPQAKLDTLANILVACVNSTGPTSSACAALFSAATPSGGTAPTTVLGAIVDIALNPTNNVTSLYNIATANAAFQPTLTSAPAVWNVIVSGGASTPCGFSGGGDSVSGTVNYGGIKTGRIYLALNNTTGCGVGTEGTSISAAGAYTIRNVPPGTYTLVAFMDTLGYGSNNAADPVGSVTVNVNNPNLTAPTLTLADPAPVTLTSAPIIFTAGGSNGGAILQFQATTNGNGVETATSYTLQWSTTAAFTTIANSRTFPADGTNLDFWFVTGLTDSSVYYFRAYATSAGTALGPFSTVFGPVTIGAPSVGSTVSGSISFSGTATGPMAAGFYNQDSVSAPYLQTIAGPMSMQAYSVKVPNSASAVYIPVATIDQNNNGIIDPGDITNVNAQGTPLSVTGTIANQNLILPSGNAIARVSTDHSQTPGGQTYAIDILLTWLAKLPVKVTLLPSANPDGANVTGPTDIASCGAANSCGGGSLFQIFFNLGTTAPTVGDTYLLNVTYSDGTSETLVLTVTGVLNTFATSLAPTTGTSASTTPTFTWTDPVCGACNTYTYQLLVTGPAGIIWGVPSYGSGLAPGTTSVTWGVDPTGVPNAPSVGSLSPSTSYNWKVLAQDVNFNSATQTVTYQP